MRTWLLVGAERREFDGLLKRVRADSGVVAKLEWPDVRFAREVTRQGDRWWLIANGPGPDLVSRALAQRREVDGIVSTGFCGALDPALRIGDIVVSGEIPLTSDRKFALGRIHTAKAVAVTSEEKRTLHAETNAVAVEMEAEAVRRKAAEWSVPFACVKVVSDNAAGDLPLDFNRYRTAEGDFSRTRIALTAIARPFSVLPRLMAFDRDCQRASEALGDFLANCRF